MILIIQHLILFVAACGIIFAANNGPARERVFLVFGLIATWLATPWALMRVFEFWSGGGS